jgi:glycine/D-amino acid oxidase-like deaminating enzyme
MNTLVHLRHAHVPAMPSNVPIIGNSKLPNLYLNTEHGALR